jgi:MFS superfamily sulfate permease-like transporter
MDMRGIAFLSFTGFGALVGLFLAAVFGCIVALFGGSFWLTVALVLAFMTGVGAVVGLLAELTG